MFFEFIQRRIFSSVQNVKMFFSIICAKNFEIINFDNFITHTSRNDRYVRNFV